MLEFVPSDARLIGVAAAGSYLTGDMDAFSDLDLIVVTEPEMHDGVMRDRRDIAGKLGDLLAAFTGEHVGEPRLLICLYGEPLLHVDLKFVSLADAHKRVEEPAVLWDRDGKLAAAFASGKAHYPEPDINWIEERFWIWVHYGAGKIGRGELFEAIDLIGYLRATVLGPLALQRAGARPQGVRRLESQDAGFAEALRGTVPACDAADCLRALRVCVDLYRGLRAALRGRAAAGAAESAAESAATAYLDEIERLVRQA